MSARPSRSSSPWRYAAVGAVGAVALLGLVACGDDSKVTTSPASSAAAAGASTTAGGATTTAAGATTTAKASGSTTTAKASGSDTSSGNLSKDFVAAVNAVAKGDCAKATSISKIAEGNMDPSALGGQMKDLASAMNQLGSSGPSEVRADFATMAKAFDTIAKLYDTLGLNDPTKLATVMTDPAKMAELEKASKAMDDKAVTEAGDRITKWFESKCPGITKTDG